MMSVSALTAEQAANPLINPPKTKFNMPAWDKIKPEHFEPAIEWAIEKAKLPWGVKLLSEFGIGINPKAEILGPTVINEKKLGTCHIAIGSNSWFGGDIFAVTHFDQVFNNPTIEIDGKPLDLKKIFDSTS